MKSWGDLVKGMEVKSFKSTLTCATVVGLLAHGMALFNKLSWRNDLDRGFLLNQTKALTLGRWSKAALNELVATFFGGSNLSLPLIYGLLAIVFIAFSAHLIIRMFDIRRPSLQKALIAMMIVFPVVTSTFGYMYCAPYYFFALLLAVFGVYVAVERPRWDGFIVAAFCFACCLGIYQAYFPIAVALFVIMLIFEIARERFDSFPKAVLRGVYYLATCVVGLALYFVIWKLTMKVFGLSANTHMGMEAIGTSGLKQYIKAIVKAYKSVLMIFDGQQENLYPMGLAWLQWVLLALSGVCAVCLVVRRFRKNPLQAVMMAVLIAILPLCFNLIYPMAASTPEDSYVYTLMLYGQCMLYVFLICGLDFIASDDGKKALFALRRVGIAALTFMICLNVYFDNSCYNKAQVLLQQTISDFTVMISRVQSMEGYDDAMSFCLVEGGKRSKAFTELKAFDDLQITPFAWVHPYHHTTYSYDFMKKWCGFNPKKASASKFEDNEEVKAMTVYPDDGSIKIIDGTVVVKW